MVKIKQMISHELKTIFIHLPRTGGTSVETALVGNNWWKIHPQTKHIEWKEAKKLYSDYWDEYLKFTIIRDPWDWIASLYFSHDRGGKKTWEEYVLNPNFYAHEPSTMIQSEIIGEEMDFIFRYETLHEDFIRLCQKLGIERRLPHTQLGESTYKHYSEVYNDKLADTVAEIFKDDIKRFRYKFISREIAEAQDFKSTISALKERIAILESELQLERQGLLKRSLNLIRQPKK